MSLFHPNALLWGLLAILVAAFYYVRLARRQRDVSTLMLWRQALARRSAWRRWQRPVSMLMQLAIVALIVLALAEPYWTAAVRDARSIVVILDTSASMKAMDAAPNRFSLAMRDAGRMIDDLQRYEQMAIISAGGPVKIPCRFTRDQKILRRSLAGVGVTDGPNRMREAIELARHMCAEKRNPQIVILSDGCFADAAELSVAENVHVVAGAGKESSAAANVGITRFEHRPSLTEPTGVEVFIEVTNFGSSRADCRLLVGLQGDVPREEMLHLPANEAWREVLAFEAAPGGLLTARLDISDDLAADNAVWALLSPRTTRRIRVAGMSETSVGDPRQRLMVALKNLPAVRVEVTPQLDGTQPGEVAVFAGAVPERLPAGPVLAVAPEGDCDLWSFGGITDSPAVVSSDAIPALLSPVLAGVDLRSVVIDKLAVLDAKQTPAAVVRSETGQPVLSAWQRDAGRVLLLHIPLDESDLTVREAFPILLANAIRWLAGVSDHVHPSQTTAEVITRAATESRTLVSPTGLTYPVVEGQRRLGPLDEVGLWRIVQPLTDEGLDAVANAAFTDVAPSNLLDARESDLRRAADLATSDLPITGRHRGSTMWMMLLAAALVLLVLDWVLYQRRVLV